MNKDLNKGVGVSCEMVINKDGKVLMGKRGRVFGKGSWAFPGGHLEMGENVEECVKRELMEEVGITPTKMKLLSIINDIPNIKGQVRQYIRFVFLIEDFSGKVINKEPDKCYGWEWFDLNNLPKPIFVGHEKVLKYFFSGRKDFFVEE